MEGDGIEEYGQEVAVVAKEDKKSYLNVKEKSLWDGKIQHGVFQC